MTKAITELLQYVGVEDLDLSQCNVNAEEQDVLDEVSQRVMTAEPLPDLLGYLCERTREFSPCDRLSLVLLEEDQARLTVQAVAALYEPLLLGIGYSESCSHVSLGECLKSGAARIIQNMEAYRQERPENGAAALLAKEGLRSSLATPLYVGEQVVGFLVRSSKQPQQYSGHDVLFNGLLGERLTLAIESLVLRSQLAAAKGAYHSLLQFVSEKLHAPLSSLALESDLMLKGHLGRLDPSQEGLISALAESAHTLIANTYDFVELEKLESGNWQVDLLAGVTLWEEVLQPVMEQLEQKRRALGTKIVLNLSEEVRSVVCDRDKLKLVFTLLLENAFKYGQKGGKIRISTQWLGEKWRCSIWNSGVGFPVEQTVRLFKKFSRLTVPEYEQIDGTGVGLYLAWQIIQQHGGRLYGQSEYGEWAEFIFELPLQQ